MEVIELVSLKNWEGIYEISENGEVMNSKSGQYLTHSINADGYHYVQLRRNGVNTNHLVHRLVSSTFLENPDNKPLVDHVDGDVDNNNLSNLRYATASENQQNRRNASNNTSGTKGISWYKPNKKWRARIMLNKKSIHIGLFEKKQDAINARKLKALQLFGEFLNQIEVK